MSSPVAAGTRPRRTLVGRRREPDIARPGGDPGDPGAPSVRHARLALSAALLANFVMILDGVIVNVTLPSIRHSLGGGLEGLQWVVDGYTLMFAGLLLSSGSLVDRLGARRALAGGTVVFMLSSTACGLAAGVPELVTARFVQGSAAAVMLPATMSLIRHAYPDARARAGALAIWALGGGTASSAAPVLGGALDAITWRLIFLINIPVSLICLALLVKGRPSPRRPAPFDWPGQITAVLAMGGLTYAAIEAGNAGIRSARVIVAVLVAVLAAIALAVREGRARHPMLPPELFRSRGVRGLVAIGFAHQFGYYGMPFVVSLYLQQVRGLSALSAGVLFVPMMAAGVVFTPFWPQLSDRMGRPTLIGTGMALIAAGLLAIGLMPASTPDWVIAAAMVAVGIGGPMVIPPSMATLMDVVPSHLIGTGNGVFNTSRQVGGALAVAIFGGLLTDPATFLHGVHVSMFIGVGVVLLTIPAITRLHPPTEPPS